jgi:hypothetical protein
LFGCGAGKFVFFGADALLEGFDFFVAGSGVAFGPFGGAVKGVDAGTHRFQVEQAAPHLGKVGGVAAERCASEALMSDGAAVAFGCDVLGVGAFAEWHCDRGSFVGEPVFSGHRPDGQVLAIDNEVSDDLSCLTPTLLRDSVVPHGS